MVDFIGRIFKLVFAIIVAVVLVYLLFPAAYHYTVPIEWLESTWTRSAGVALLLLPLAWMVIAQAQMGQSWRIGIDTEH